MAEELGDTSVERIRAARSEDAHVEVAAGDIEALAAEGFLVCEGDQVRLTPNGREIAEQVARRHRLTEMLLFTWLGIDRDLASEIGCRVEHGVREELLDNVCTLLGHPATCPHGRPIPAGPCCREGRTTVESQIVPLTALKPGERGRVVYIKPRDHHRLHRLSSMGLNPGVMVELHQRRPAFCLRFEETELALDRQVAEDIQVSRLPREEG
jgi:DtxR family Mn-dependent transcriptional regulator